MLQVSAEKFVVTVKKFLTIWRFTAENWEIKKIISSASTTSSTNERERWHKIINPINLIFSYNAFLFFHPCAAITEKENKN